MILWFAVIAGLGLQSILQRPEILAALNPLHGVTFFQHNGIRGFLLLGAVVLCITGCEALYADMGHFGAKSIRLSWYFVALPALFLNYFGQGALILSDPKTATDSFYGLVPHSLLYPMVVLATHGDHYRLPGHHFRGLFVDQAGHAIGLPAAPAAWCTPRKWPKGRCISPK